MLLPIKDNPWKGLDSYTYSDSGIFYGRDNETETLIEIIYKYRFTILYGPSGVGKSSLINAGLRPRLATANNFVIYISMRDIDLMSGQTISSQIISKIKNSADDQDIDISSLSKDLDSEKFRDSLWYFFYTNEFWSQKNELLTPIVIIDQFEDIFKDEVIENSPNQFFKSIDELSNAVPPISIREDLQQMQSFRYNKSAVFRFVFSLREDFIPRLDDYVYSLNIPELRKSRYNITLMDKDQAREVILGPADGIISANVADNIIEILSPQNNQHNLAQKIEPFLLSLYMYRVHIEMKKRGLSSISEDLIHKIGSDVVNDFYIESMKKVSSKAMKHLENVLLTHKGHRDSISYDRLKESNKVTDEELKTLLETRIINKKTINNVDRFEFTHDVLSKYAKKNKEKRELENKSIIFVGILGTLLTLLLSVTIGWIMSSTLTYLSIPILIVISVITSCGIFNIKFSSKTRILLLLLSCLFLGICIDFAQVIPKFGYVIYCIVCGLAIYPLSRLLDLHQTTSSIQKYLSVGVVWSLSFIIIPVLCFGYNIFIGMNFSREEPFSKDAFYVKNSDNQYGIRNRFSMIIPPQYDDTLHKINSHFLVKADGKYGLIDSQFQSIKSIEYDTITNIDSVFYFYIDGKEITDNGLRISWKNDISEKRKAIVRKIVNNMVKIKGGEFQMGTNLDRISNEFSNEGGYVPLNGEEYIHNVSLSDFYLNKYEVTLEDWIEIMNHDPRPNYNQAKADTINNLNIPVYKISYNDCMEFVDILNHLTGLNFSLPTEAQWEYAARGGSHNINSLFSGSNSIYQVSWVGLNSLQMPHEVGSKNPNILGLYDMTGNVFEFCKDRMSPTFYKESEGMKNPCCDNEKIRQFVRRGGCYQTYNRADYIVTRRIKVGNSQMKYIDTGFRLALNIDE